MDTSTPLPNGAQPVALWDVPQGGSVVLAKLARAPEHLEYATWRRDPRGGCHWGHYFSIHEHTNPLEVAKRDFLRRVEELGG